MNCAQSQLDTQANNTGLENNTCNCAPAFDNITYILSVSFSLVYKYEENQIGDEDILSYIKRASSAFIDE